MTQELETIMKELQNHGYETEFDEYNSTLTYGKIKTKTVNSIFAYSTYISMIVSSNGSL